MLERLSKILNSVMQTKGISWISSLVLNALGIAGGFWAWLVGVVVKIGWQKADKEIQSGARLADRTKSDKEIREDYLEKIKEGASEEDLVESELDILNGGRRK